MALRGEAGIGRTRLAEEPAGEAERRGWGLVWGYVYAQESAIPYRLWREALRRIIMQGLWQERDLAQHPRFSEPLEALLPEMRDLFVHEEQDEVVENARERESGHERPDQSGPYQ